MENLFAEKIIQEEIITFTFRGDQFANHEISLASLVAELRGVEILIRESVDFYRKKHKLGEDQVKFEILVKIENGSVKQVVKIIKKNAVVLALLTNFVMPFVQAGFEYYLNNRQTTHPDVVQILEGNKKVRQSFGDILAPINGNNNSVVINTGDITYEIKGDRKEGVIDEIQAHENELSKIETTKDEDLLGVVSVSKLYDPSPFSFRINQTAQDVPLYFDDLKFDLADKQDFLGKELALRARVTYKNNRRISIAVLEYKPIDKLFGN